MSLKVQINNLSLNRSIQAVGICVHSFVVRETVNHFQMHDSDVFITLLVVRQLIECTMLHCSVSLLAKNVSYVSLFRCIQINVLELS